MPWFADYSLWGALFTLTTLEIVLGIDNIIFIALTVAHLPKAEARRARIIGLGLALFFRIAMLFGIVWIIGMTKPFLTLFSMTFSAQGLMLLAGGLFLIYQGTNGIHQELSGEKQETYRSFKGSFLGTVAQIILIDIVFSFDSVITAVGITKDIYVIVAAMSIAMIVMLALSGYISAFIARHPALKMLALAFVIMIGLLLVSEGFGIHVPRGYIYFGMCFSLSIEVLNMIVRRRRTVAP